MKTIDLKEGQIFIFYGGHRDKIYLKTECGYKLVFNPVEADLLPYSEERLEDQVIALQKHQLYEKFIPFEMDQIAVNELMKTYLLEHKKMLKFRRYSPLENLDPEIKVRTSYSFTCTRCGKLKRTSFFLDKAKNKVCRNCQKFLKVTENTIPMFGSI